MLKVLYLLNHAGKAGTERYVYSLIEKLNNKKIKAYFAYNEEGLLVERLKTIGVETFQIRMRNPFDIKAIWDLSKLCKKLEIDLIHTQFLRENYIAIFSRILNSKVRVIYTNHFILPNNSIQKFFNRVLTPFEANIIAVCNKGREMLIANGNKASKIKVVFNGIDPSYWGEPLESTVREEFAIGEDEFVILCASRFAHDKGHKFLVNSINELKKMTGRKFRCILAGDGPLLPEVKEQVSNLGLNNEIIFTGFRSDVKNLFYGSDLYVNSSEHEALSFLIIESLASGLPVIATNMGGNSDIINAETNCGILVEYDNAKEMAEAILKVMEDGILRQKLRENALKAVKERFSLDKVVEKTYNLYVDSIRK
ncbi:MAG: glycosyltransferase [Firmicutes bacterium]|nr:glycosyltransferase [Bacillota bacterium]